MNITMTNRQGKTLSVAISGQDHAPVIVFSNSLGTDKGMWQPQVAAFEQQFKVVTYDTRGHGQSDVIDILNGLNIEKAHFCRISMGGMTALWLGIHHADRFHSITVANSAAKIWNEEGWNARADTVIANGLVDLVATTHTRWFSEQFDYQHDALAQRTIQSLATTPALGYAESCRALAQADLSTQIQQIQIPTLVIAGAFDPVTTVADGVFMQQQIQKSELAVIDASHLSNIEQPELFTQTLSQFIGSIQ